MRGPLVDQLFDYVEYTLLNMYEVSARLFSFIFCDRFFAGMRDLVINNRISQLLWIYLVTKMMMIINGNTHIRLHMTSR